MYKLFKVRKLPRPVAPYSYRVSIYFFIRTTRRDMPLTSRQQCRSFCLFFATIAALTSKRLKSFPHLLHVASAHTKRSPCEGMSFADSVTIVVIRYQAAADCSGVMPTATSPKPAFQNECQHH